VAGASTSAVTADPPPPPPPPETPTSTEGLVEVQLVCSMSYTAPLYDSPSGHFEAASTVDAMSATTTSSVANVIGEQSWTVCHDARGNEHEFRITAAEYEALKIRGTPQKSVMEPAEEAALDAFPPDPSADTSETSTSAI